jgi:HSP20 family protein
MSTLIPWRTASRPISRLAPWAEFESFQDRLERMLGRPFQRALAEEPMAWAPAVDLKETDAEFVMTAEFPGMTEKEITIDVEQNTLTLRGEKKSEHEEKREKNGRWHVVERSWGAFERSFTLPSTVDAQKIKAEFKDGLLTIHLPKREKSNARRIPIGTRQ